MRGSSQGPLPTSPSKRITLFVASNPDAPIDGTHGAAHSDLDAPDVLGLRRFWAEARGLSLATGADPRFVSLTIPAPR